MRPAAAAARVGQVLATGGALHLAWDADTDRGGYGGTSFACAELLDFPLVAVATSCAWTSDATLTANLDYRATCAPGDNVTSLGGVLRAKCVAADCSCWPTANATTAPLGPPDEPLTPVAQYVGAASVGACSDLAIDATTSTGSGGRAWTSIAWSVNGTLPARNLTELRAHLTASAGSTTLQVESTLLRPGEAYTFTASLTNFLGFSSSDAADGFAVRVDAGAIPEVFITAGANARVLAPQSVALFARASVAACPGESGSSAALRYAWSCSFAAAASTSVDPRYFKLDPFTLNASSSYEVSVNVTDKSGLSNVARTTVHVGASALVAAIDGGDRRVGLSESLSLDASASYDPDRPEARGLLYSWSCRDAAGAPCYGVTLASQSINVIDAAALAALGAGSFDFEIIVSELAHGAGRNATASVRIELVVDAVPQISISALTAPKANPSARLVLEGVASATEHAVDFAWSLVRGDLAGGSLEASAATQRGHDPACAPGRRRGQVPRRHRGRAHRGRDHDLSAHRVVHRRHHRVRGRLLSAHGARERAADAGALTVAPARGSCCRRRLTSRAIWVDDADDLPLLYSFFFAVAGDDATEFQLVSGSALTSYSGALLPQGGGNSSEVVGIAQIADQYAASARATDVVIVRPAPRVSVRTSQTAPRSCSPRRSRRATVEAIFNTAVTSASVLNAPNCTGRGCGVRSTAASARSTGTAQRASTASSARGRRATSCASRRLRRATTARATATRPTSTAVEARVGRARGPLAQLAGSTAIACGAYVARNSAQRRRSRASGIARLTARAYTPT